MKYIFYILIFSSLFCDSLCSQNKQEIDSLENVFKTTKIDTVKAKTLLELSEAYTYSEPTLSFEYARKCKALSDKINFSYCMSRSLIRLGILYDAVSKPDSALCFLEQAKVIAIKEKDKRLIASIQNNIGMAYFDKAEYDKALTNYLGALKVGEELNNDKIIASTYNNIANLHFVLKNYKKALEFHEKSLKIARKLNDKFKIASSLNNIGIAYRESGEYDKAIKAFDESLTLAKEMGNKMGIGLLLNNLGAAYRQSKEYEKALQFYAESMKIKREIGDKRGVAHCYSNIGGIYLDLKNYNLSIDNCLKAIEIAKEIHDKGILYDVYSNLSQAYAEKKQFEKAYEFHKLFITYRDSVFDLEKSEQMAEMSTKYESEKKDQEIKLLNKDKVLQDTTIKMQKAEAKRQSAIRTSMLIGIALLAVLAVFIFRSYRIKRRSNIELFEKNTVINTQKHSLEEKQKAILDSIHYAKRIQDAMLQQKELISSFLPDSFIYFNPKDIVSGDFYWATENNNKFYLAVCDSTGHGVPGAFMSLLNSNFLNEAINEKKIDEPGEIFDYVRTRLIDSISKDGQKDGFDGILMCFDKRNNAITYAAANNSPLLISNGVFVELEENRMPVGKGERVENFTTHKIEINKGETIYLYTDGYADQFGGPKGKKFKYKQLNELLLRNSSLSMPQQCELLDETFIEWKGVLEQVDDVAVVGIKL